jgi:hypothetical protein
VTAALPVPSFMPPPPPPSAGSGGSGLARRLLLLEGIGRVAAFFLVGLGFLIWAWAYAEQVANSNCASNCPAYNDAAVLGTVQSALVTLALGALLLAAACFLGMVRSFHRPASA